MKTKGLEYYISLVDKAEAGCGKIDSNFERSSTVGKTPLNSITCHREIIHERKSQLIWQTSLAYFKQLSQPPQLSATTALTSRQPSTLRQDPLPTRM